LCPCRMRNVQVREGRYVEVIDHGPSESVKIEPRVMPSGCICPPTAEQTCKGPLCPRKAVSA
jgi:hypothetical protein